jgi:hypothetical protein
LEERLAGQSKAAEIPLLRATTALPIDQNSSAMEPAGASRAFGEPSEETTEAVIATSVVPEENGAMGDEAPRWPDEASESAFLSDQRSNGAPSMPLPRATAKDEERTSADAAEPAALPALQSLLERIPPEALATLDELFRARFVSVKRVQKNTLK